MVEEINYVLKNLIKLINNEWKIKKCGKKFKEI